MAYDRAAFHALQGRLAEMWPVLTVRGVAQRPGSLVVVSSLTTDLPEAVRPLVTAYEERYLFYLISLARFEHTRVVYVTSMPMLPRLAHYYLGLVHGTERASERLTVVSVGDPSSGPLTRKILDRPLLVDRLRRLVGDPRHGLLMPFLSTELEAELALALGVPMYGPDPELQPLGTKSGSREVFAAADVPHPRGASRLRDRSDVVAALVDLQQERPVRRAVVKTDAGFAGQGNAVVDLVGTTDKGRIADAVDRLRPEDRALSPGEFLEALARGGGVVEEWIDGDEVCSPSVQLRGSP